MKTTPLPLPGGAAAVGSPRPPTQPLLATPLGKPENWKPRTRRQAIKKKAFGPPLDGAAFKR